MSSDGAREPQNWKVKKNDGSRLEPANLSVLRQWVASRQIEPDDLVINDELSDWIPAAHVIELFDLFEHQHGQPPRRRPPVQPEEQPEVSIEIPDCAYHAGRAATEICVGCGKFICSECADRFENKLYCRRCLAEKQVVAESGVQSGPGAVAQIIPGAPVRRTNRLSIASLIFAVVALASSFLLLLPGFRMAVAPAVGFVSFLAALLAAIALSNLRTREGSARARQFALAGLLIGLSLLIVSVAAISLSIQEFRSTSSKLAQRDQGEIVPQTGRRQGAPVPAQSKVEREANAHQLLEQVIGQLNAGQLEQAVVTARTLVGLYPETKAGKILEERLPELEQALAQNQAREQEVRLQNEELARGKLEEALQMNARGEQVSAIDVLTDIIALYPETDTAARAQEEMAKIQEVLEAQQRENQEKQASVLAGRARKHLDAGQYEQAAEAYRRMYEQYPNTSAAAAARADYQEAQLLVSDPSERKFREIEKNMAAQTYEETIEQLQEFLAQYSNSERFEEAKELLQENQTNKSIADGLYTFGKNYLSQQKYSLALGRYEKLINEHSRSQWTPQARKDYEEVLEKLKE